MKLLKTIILIRTNKKISCIQSPTINPIVGSGKISRKVRVISERGPRNAQRWNMKIKGKRIRKLTPEKEKQTLFGSIKVKQAFNHWCTLGKPMINHVIGPSKTFTRSVILLRKALKKNELSEIIEAMDLANETFNSDWFIHKRYFQRNKIILPSFIKYVQYHKNVLPIKMQSVDSWLEEFLQGRKYIEKNYSVILKDKYPHVSQPLSEAWKTYTKQDELTIDESNGIVELSTLVVKFAEANKNTIGELDITDLINQILNHWDNRYNPKNIGWLLNSIFWNIYFPKALVKYGTFENIRDINFI